ncbi:MAG: hypothetical protein JXO51_05715 [Candidatus Aminicenantes bacterium]|nr:hypothetical protein [Candidatus Aminicenantes bacterium]
MIAEQEADRTMAVLKIIWMAMLGSLAVYGIVGRLVAPNLTSTLGAETVRMLRIALYALGFVTVNAAVYMRRLILGAKGSSAGPVQAGPSPLPQKYSSAVIVSLAMSESVGIYGLVLFLLGKNARDLYLLLGISGAALFYFRPRKEELLQHCR